MAYHRIRTPPKKRVVRLPKPGLIPDYSVYRLYDDDERLLYVGITRDLTERLRTHRGTKAWWPEVAAVSVTLYEAWRAAEEAEALAIRTENPVHNIAGRKGSGYTLDLVEEAPMPSVPPARPSEEDGEPPELLVDHVAVHHDALEVDGTKLTGVTVNDVMIASQDPLQSDVVLDLRVRVRARRVELVAMPPRALPTAVDF